MTNTRRKPNPVAELRREMPAGVSRARRSRKSLRQHFREGLEYGLKAEPTAFAATRLRTMMGLMVRELVCAAAGARCDAIRLVFDFVDEGELLRGETATDDAGDDSQGNIALDSTHDVAWDWNEAGWDSSQREKKPGELDAERAARTEALRQELFEKFIRAAEGERENEERAARLAAEQTGRAVFDEPLAPFSGNSGSDLAGTVRIGGRLVRE